jgi:hypothetical protein
MESAAQIHWLMEALASLESPDKALREQAESRLKDLPDQDALFRALVSVITSQG